MHAAFSNSIRRQRRHEFTLTMNGNEEEKKNLHEHKHDTMEKFVFTAHNILVITKQNFLRFMLKGVHCTCAYIMEPSNNHFTLHYLRWLLFFFGLFEILCSSCPRHTDSWNRNHTEFHKYT